MNKRIKKKQAKRRERQGIKIISSWSKINKERVDHLQKVVLALNKDYKRYCGGYLLKE